MKPFGLTNPHDPTVKAYAVVQLRQDNALGTLFNMVGFQTKLKHAEQVRIFRTIPGLEKAEFARLGGLHRNTFLNSPKLLDATLRLKAMPRLRFAGQITGCEGYVESAASACWPGASLPPSGSARRRWRRRRPRRIGALLGHITGGHVETIDAGPALVPADERQFRPVSAARRADREPRRQAAARHREDHRQETRDRERALADLDRWRAGETIPQAAE